MILVLIIRELEGFILVCNLHKNKVVLHGGGDKLTYL